MNLLKLDRAPDGYRLRGADGPALFRAPDGVAEVGIRPEALRLAPDGIPARVLLAEYLGADTDARLRGRRPAHPRPHARAGARSHPAPRCISLSTRPTCICSAASGQAIAAVASPLQQETTP